jgi:hypothetical protein
VYELLSDLAAIDEVDLSRFLVGHCCVPLTTPNGREDCVEVMNRDLNQIEQSFGAMSSQKKMKKGLDYVTFAVTGPSDAEGCSKFEELVAIVDQRQPSASIGFHFSTPLLQSLGEGDELNKTLEYLSPTLDYVAELTQKRPFVSISANYITVKNAMHVASWAKERHDCELLASEVLRLHEKRPSLLSLPVSMSMSSQQLSRTPTEAMVEAMENLKVSIDRCIHMEMQFIDRLFPTFSDKSEDGSGEGEPKLEIHDLCVGHALMHTQDSIHSSEEWNYLLRRQIEPRWEHAMELVSKESKETSEWASLYTSLARHLFSSFTDVQNTRKYLLIEDVMHSIGGAEQNDVVKAVTMDDLKRASHDLSPLLGTLSKSLIKADHVTLAGVEVETHRWIEGNLGEPASAVVNTGNADPEQVILKVGKAARTYSS